MESEVSKKTINHDITNQDNIKRILNDMNFELREMIGEGSYGKVFKIFNKIEKKYFVAKLVEINVDESVLLEFTRREIEILYQEHHKNLIKLIFYKHFDNGLLLVMEFADRGDLYQYISGMLLNEDQFFCIFKEIYSGIKYLHSKNIEHRDLKLENVLITKHNIIKICDFGLARKIDDLHNNYNTQIKFQAEEIGSPQCLCPEAICKKESPLGSVDIWSLGCIAFHLIFGFYPFERCDASNITQLKEKIVNEDIKYNYPKDKSISKECIEMVKMLLEKDPKKRINCKTIESLPFYIMKNKRMANDSYNKFFKNMINSEKGYDSDQTINNCKMKDFHIKKKEINYNNPKKISIIEKKPDNSHNYIAFTKTLQFKFPNFLEIIPESEALKILEVEYINKHKQSNHYTDSSKENINDKTHINKMIQNNNNNYNNNKYNIGNPKAIVFGKK